jgi:hypothetical protein
MPKLVQDIPLTGIQVTQKIHPCKVPSLDRLFDTGNVQYHL